MSFTLYASFRDVLLAERAAGALLDHGVHTEDISLVTNDAAGHARVTPATAVPVDAPAAINTGGDMAIYTTNDPPVANLSAAEAQAATANQAAANQAAVNQAAVNQAAVNQAAVNQAVADKVVVDHASAVPGAVAPVPVSTAPVGTVVPVSTAPVGTTPVGTVVPVSTAPVVTRVDPVVGTPVIASEAAPVIPVEPYTAADPPADPEFAAKGGLTTTTTADAEVGAVKGAGIGLGLGILAGLAVIVVPGFGLVVGGGALAMAIGAMAATTAAGAIAGGVTGFLIDQGVPEETARVYQTAVEHGGAMLAVRVPSGSVDSATVEHLLTKYSAYDVQVF